MWLAPEVLKEEEYTEKADIYSFGVILWELLTRKQFFGEYKFLSEIEEKIISGQRPAIPDTKECRAVPEYIELLQECWDGGTFVFSPFFHHSPFIFHLSKRKSFLPLFENVNDIIISRLKKTLFSFSYCNHFAFMCFIPFFFVLLDPKKRPTFEAIYHRLRQIRDKYFPTVILPPSPTTSGEHSHSQLFIFRFHFFLKTAVTHFSNINKVKTITETHTLFFFVLFCITSIVYRTTQNKCCGKC